MQASDIFLGLIAILFPPLAVWIKRSICSIDSLINIALCCLGYFPGLLHAWYIIAYYPDPDPASEHAYQVVPQPGDDLERGFVSGGDGRPREGSVTFYYVGHRQSGAGTHRGSVDGGAGVGSPRGAGQRGYGTVGPAGPSPDGQLGSGNAASGGVPPTYEQAVKGDNKVQTQT